MHQTNYNNNIITDLQGFLINAQDWNETIAIQIARSEGIELQTMHWEIINFVRMFYKEYQNFPKIRTLIKIIALKHGPEKGNSRYLIKLFPKQSVVQQIAKIAGLPKPSQCV